MDQLENQMNDTTLSVYIWYPAMIIIISVGYYMLTKYSTNTNHVIPRLLEDISECGCHKCVSFMVKVRSKCIEKDYINGSSILKFNSKYKTVIVFSATEWVYYPLPNIEFWRKELMLEDPQRISVECTIVDDYNAILNHSWNEFLLQLFIDRYVMSRMECAAMNTTKPKN